MTCIPSKSWKVKKWRFSLLLHYKKVYLLVDETKCSCEHPIKIALIFSLSTLSFYLDFYITYFYFI